MKAVHLVLLVFAFSALSYGFYLPGVAPVEYMEGDLVPLKVNKMVSSKTQVPYPYYSLAFCRPEEGVKDMAENLGEILMGDKIENSPYVLEAGIPAACKLLCTVNVTAEEMKKFEKRIKQDYRINWILDNLPAATKKTFIDFNGNKTEIYETGFPLGAVEGDSAYLHNHINMKILYHTSADFEGRRIVRFEVEPQSIKHTVNSTNPTAVPDTCLRPLQWQLVSESQPGLITFTYSVDWEYNRVKWSSRWDVYLTMTDTQIHWFSIVNSLLILIFLTGMVAMIIMRTLHADFRRYREIESQEEAQEETGWKLVHGDVFRAPSYRMLLSVLIGSGVQVFLMAVITLVFALLGFLSPANRGALMTAVVVLFLLMALFSGYFSARMYKVFKGTEWKKNAIMTASFLPGFVFSIFFLLNIVLGFERSSGYVRFSILLGLLALWFGISTPLALFGSYLGFKKPAPENPVRTNQIPRQIPEQVWYMRPALTILMGGILPFGAVFIELFFILSSIWQHQIYYMFGFLFMVFLILLITCAEITIVMCYFQLCSEDYHWWWRSYLTSGASAFYMFLYALFYFFTKLEITSLASILLYFGYTLIMASIFFVLTGSVGFYSCYFFVRRIYKAVRVE